MGDKLTPEELAEFREIFNLVDKDGGGTISKEELGELMETLGIDATPEEIHVAPGTLRALGLANDDDTDPLCVVAAGSAPWSRAEHDAGSCLLA